MRIINSVGFIAMNSSLIHCWISCITTMKYEHENLASRLLGVKIVNTHIFVMLSRLFKMLRLTKVVSPSVTIVTNNTHWTQ